MTDLAKKRCTPCLGGVPKLTPEQIRHLATAVAGWKVVGDHHLEKEYAFPDFAQALAFVNKLGAIAEAEGHHPLLLLTWGKVKATIWTHKIDGLTLRVGSLEGPVALSCVSLGAHADDASTPAADDA